MGSGVKYLMVSFHIIFKNGQDDGWVPSTHVILVCHMRGSCVDGMMARGVGLMVSGCRQSRHSECINKKIKRHLMTEWNVPRATAYNDVTQRIT